MTRSHHDTKPLPARWPAVSFRFDLAALLLAACSTPPKPDAAAAGAGYFDPHTHLSGVLPWPAHANLPAYLDALQESGAGVSHDDKLAFYHWLAQDWYPA